MGYTLNPFTGNFDAIDKTGKVTARIAKEATGFTDPGSVVVTYDSATRKITLTGTVEAYWQSKKIPELVSGWVSEAHTATNGNWFLYYNGTAFVWSQTVWTFDMVQIAIINYGTTYKWGMREPHGVMQWQSHQELHQTIGCYLTAGGDLTGVTIGSSTAAERRPIVSATTIKDEDNPSSLPTLTSSLYTQFYLSGAGTSPSFNLDAADVVPLSGNNPYYNQYTGAVWQQTLMSNNSYQAIWLVAVATTADDTSQKYRYMWVQGQSEGSLSVINALTPSSINLDGLGIIVPEFVFVSKVILKYIGGNWSVTSIEKLTGTKINQVATPAGSYLSIVSTDTSLTGDGTSGNPLSASSKVDKIVSGGGSNETSITSNGYDIILNSVDDVSSTSVTIGASTGLTSTGTITATNFVGIKDNIGFVVDGGGSVVTTGTKKARRIVPVNCTITGWTLLADQIGSTVVTVKRCTYANYPTTSAISGTEKPTLSSVIKNQDLSLSTWTTSLTAGDILEISVDSATTITSFVLNIHITTN
jgi:hypothetical protein